MSCPLSLPFSNSFLRTPRTTNGSLCQCDSCDSWLHMDSLAIKSYLQAHLAQPYTIVELWGSEGLSAGPVFSLLLHHLHSSLLSQVQLPWLPLFKWDFGLMTELVTMPDLTHRHCIWFLPAIRLTCVHSLCFPEVQLSLFQTLKSPSRSLLASSFCNRLNIFQGRQNQFTILWPRSKCNW